MSTRARRTAVTLIGSKVAFRTRTGACIIEGRLAAAVACGGTELAAGAATTPIFGLGRNPPFNLSSLSTLWTRSLPVRVYETLDATGVLFGALIRCLPDGTPGRKGRRPPRHGACDGEADDARGAGPAEGPGAGIESRAGGKYIIYQQYAEVVNRRARARGVGATHRFPALAARENEFVRPGPGAHEQIAAQRQAQAPRQRARGQLRLVVAALAPPRRMERHRHDDIGGGRLGV